MNRHNTLQSPHTFGHSSSLQKLLRKSLCCLVSADLSSLACHFNQPVKVPLLNSVVPFVFSYAYGPARIRVFEYGLSRNTAASRNGEGGACAAGAGGGACRSRKPLTGRGY